MTVEEHLRQRGFDPTILPVYIDEEERIACFPLFNLSGQMIGYQNYRPDVEAKRSNNPRDARYFTRTNGGTFYYGANALDYRKGYVIVSEGIFDICKIATLRHPVAAVLTCNNKDAFRALRLTGGALMGLCDGDSAGRLMASNMDRAIVLPDGLDAGDLDLDQTEFYLKTLLSGA